MNALRKTNPRLLAYLSYMVVERLLLMKGILKPTGSIYLALRSHGQPLHKSHDGRDFRAQEL